MVETRPAASAIARPAATQRRPEKAARRRSIARSYPAGTVWGTG